MTAVSEFDVGPLTWVKGEIDAALDRADKSLQQALAGAEGDLTQIKFGRTHLHQVHGALAIVGLDGVTQFTEALEGYLADLEQQKLVVDAAAVDLTRRGLQAIRHYLDDLLNGEANQPLRLLPLYREVLQARGAERVNPTDLFFPNLEVRPPRRAAVALPPMELAQRLRAERGHFQRGLLSWFKGDRAGLNEMRAALEAIEATQDVPAARAFWWVALGFMAAVADGTVGADADIKQLCARIDAQIRRLIEGSRNFAERLMRDALYYVAVSDSADPAVSGVKASFQLDELLPSAQGEAGHATPAQEGILRRLRDHITAAEETWGKFCAGTAQALSIFRDQVSALAQGAEHLGHPDFNRLCGALLTTTAWVAEQPSRHSDSLSMEMATGILLASTALDNFEHLGPDFAHQVDVMTARLNGCVTGMPPETGAEVPGLDDMSRQAQERLLNSQVAKEIQSNLGQIEQVLDTFFRDVSRRGDLTALEAPLKQVAGALAMLGQDAAVDLLKDCRSKIADFAKEDYIPAEADFEQVASQLSALGFFIEALPRELAKGSADFAAFSRGLGPQTAEPEVVEEEPLEAAAPSVERQLEKQKKEAQALLEAIKVQPADAGLRQELKQNLQALQKDADLVADKALGQQAKAALSALEAAPAVLESTAPELDAALAGIQTQVATAPIPSAETLKLTQASEEDLDAELVSIFLEEAQEVLATIDEHLGLLRSQPHNVDFLTTMRRSFHTLKGSGRMVGLKDLGETAWAMEQVLNLWLRQEYEVGPELFALIEHAHTVFSAWVHYLETREGGIPDAAPLVADAERLRGVEAAATTEAPAAAEVAPPVSPLADLASLGAGAVEVDLPVPGILDIDFSTPESEPVSLGGSELSPPPVSASTDLELSPEALPSLAIELEAAPALEPEAAPAPEAEPLPALDLGQLSDEVISLEVMPEEPATEDVVLDILDVPPTEVPAVEESIELPPLLEAEGEPSLEIEAVAPLEAATADLVLGQLPEEVVTLEVMPEEPSAEGVVLDILEVPLSEAPAIEESIELPPLAELEAEPEAEAAEAAELPEPLSAPVPSSSKLTLTVSPTLYQIFLEEAKTHLATLQRQFGLLETEPSMPTPEPLTRAAHTLGGIAGTIGLTPINRLGLALEHAVLRRDQSVQPNSLEALETIRLTIACLEEMVANVAAERLPEAAPHLVEALDSLYPSAATAASFVVEEVPAVLSAATLAKTVAAPEPPRQLKDELDEQLLPIFLEEAQELTQSITEQLRAWRADPADAEVARSLARLFHTLKGSARMAGAMNLGELTHALETRVEHAHKSGGVNVAFVEELQTAFDAIAQIVERLARGETLDTPVPVELLGLSEAPEAAPQVPTSGAATPAVPEQGPPVPFVERRRAKAPEAEAEAEVAGAARATLRVRADLMDRLVNEAGELSIARARIEGEMRSLKESLLDLTENVIRLRRQLREVEIQAETQIQARTAEAEERHAGFDPLEFDRFTHFQELTRMMAESVNDVATVQQNLLKNLDEANAAIVAQARLNRELQQELMSVRMVPFSSQAERLYRIVRQTAKEVDKRANLDIAGGQVELDRGLLDKMVAPLEHMLRNSVAHGLESREGRQAAGKPEIGEIDLTVAQEGNEIIITLADDGTGLDLERIRSKAIAKGLLAEGEEADAARLAEFIFTPGFSTAANVTQVAGRGVGMDVVRTEVANLGGRVELSTETGKGVTFRVYLPLTLAVTQALLVRVGNRRYAIPSAMIEQVQELKEGPLNQIRESGQVEWLGNRYTYHFLPHLLGDAAALPEARRLTWLLLLRSGTQRTAIQVDELYGNQEIVVKNVGPQLARVAGVAGATVLGDGQVLLILNPVALAARFESLQVARSEAPLSAVGTVTPLEAAPSPVANLPTVMVVDDSLTVRKITSRMLAREGYHVLTAKDGVDALEQMIDILPDVLLVDIEMPRMDGFDLTRNVRADERLKSIPIIMITSRTAEKHRTYAFEIGVNHYLGKPFQEEELLGLVQGFVAQRHQH